ncbi:MAG TPA: hypothetical protein PLL71_03915 [Agriterribacter sp.]|nr:hypothetical protein [Agriterribacter sp.]HRQ49504.1 hypothetical protein [Agriterribacter sp.]
MNYKLLRGGHLPDRKCREIVELFCDDLTATQIADISGVSRVTVNNYFRVIRSVIAAFCEDGAGQQPHVLNPGAVGDSSACYGFRLHKGKVATAWLRGICFTMVQQLYRENTAENGKTIPGLDGYHAVADCSNWQLYWPAENDTASSAVNALPEITVFWKYIKSRLQKFRGMNKSTLYLHIKECEFRYNFRDNDVLAVLTGIINSRHYLINSSDNNYVSA